MSSITPTTPVTTRELTGHILQICGSNFPYSYLSILAILRTILDRNTAVGIELALQLFPFIRPWNIKEVLTVDNPADSLHHHHHHQSTTRNSNSFVNKLDRPPITISTLTLTSISNNEHTSTLGVQSNLIIYYKYLVSLLTSQEVCRSSNDSTAGVHHLVDLTVCYRDPVLVHEFLQLSLDIGYPTTTAAGGGSSSLGTDINTRGNFFTFLRKINTIFILFYL